MKHHYSQIYNNNILAIVRFHDFSFLAVFYTNWLLFLLFIFTIYNHPTFMYFCLSFSFPLSLVLKECPCCNYKNDIKKIRKWLKTKNYFVEIRWPKKEPIIKYYHCYLAFLANDWKMVLTYRDWTQLITLDLSNKYIIKEDNCKINDANV